MQKPAIGAFKALLLLPSSPPSVSENGDAVKSFATGKVRANATGTNADATTEIAER
jgi:hypothetical protein